MKISLLLMRYFYQTKRLRLPGLGVFTLGKDAVIPQEIENQSIIPNGAQFQRISEAAADPELITFISENTGKIKPLATSDLESFIGLGIEMLNIGKPFLLEGIGTISRQPTGKFEFAPGHFGLMPVETPEKNPNNKAGLKKSADSEKSEPEQVPNRPIALGDHRNLLRGLALLAAVLIIGGGGYMLYHNRTAATGFSDSTVAVAGIMNADEKPASLQETKPAAAQPQAPAPETATVKKTTDSAALRFVILSTPNKAHALRRYNQLQSFDLKPKLFQKDSAWFKIYFEIPATMKDTLHIKDSLRRQYDANVSIDR